MYCDHNQDQSVEIIRKWADSHKIDYNSVNITIEVDGGILHPDEEKPTHWSPDHFKQVIRLREEALRISKVKWADYLFVSSDIAPYSAEHRAYIAIKIHISFIFKNMTYIYIILCG